jgi:hypothetical protein
MRKRTSFILVLAMAALLVSAISGSALAKGPGGGTGHGHGGGGTSTGGTLTLVLLNSTDGVAHYGQNVTFSVVTTATDKPMVQADCSQNGTRVYTHSAGFYPDYPWPESQTFNLASAAWTGGAADCTAKLYMSDGNGGFATLTTISFAVAA